MSFRLATPSLHRTRNQQERTKDPQQLHTPFEASMLLEEGVEIANELVDCLSHVHMANFSINGIRVGECHGGIFICSHSGLELVSTNLSQGKTRLWRSPTSISFRLLSEVNRCSSPGT